MKHAKVRTIALDYLGTYIDNSSNILEGLNSILNYIETIDVLSED
jgi:hypothetical protein